MMVRRVLLSLLLSLSLSSAWAQGVNPVHPVKPNGTALFPNAFASADNIAVQTATALHGFMFIWDGSAWDRWTGAVAQSGTWNITNISGTISLPTGAATAALQDGIIKDGAGDTTQANVSSGRLHVDATGTVTVGTFPDNEPFNVAQINGATTQIATNGLNTTGAGLLAGALAGQCDDAAVTALTENSFGHMRINCTTHHGLVQVGAELPAGTQNIGDVDIASLPNEGQQTAANSISVTPDTDNDSIGATAAAPPGEATFVGGLTSGATGGFLTGFAVCDSFVNVNVSTATTTLLVTGVSGRHVRICSISLVTAAANNVALISGTGATCGTGTTGMNGGTTAASGWNFAANGGITQGSGLGAINQTNAAADSVCIVTSAATQLSGRLSYAIY